MVSPAHPGKQIANPDHGLREHVWATTIEKEVERGHSPKSILAFGLVSIQTVPSTGLSRFSTPFEPSEARVKWKKGTPKRAIREGQPQNGHAKRVSRPVLSMSMARPVDGPSVDGPSVGEVRPERKCGYVLN